MARNCRISFSCGHSCDGLRKAGRRVLAKLPQHGVHTFRVIFLGPISVWRDDMSRYVEVNSFPSPILCSFQYEHQAEVVYRTSIFTRNTGGVAL